MKTILWLLRKIPLNTRWGTESNLADELIFRHWKKQGRPRRNKKCLCGGEIRTNTWHSADEVYGWETFCSECNFLYDED